MSMETPMSDSEGSSLELSWDELEEIMGMVKKEVMAAEAVKMDVEECPPIKITPVVST